MDLRDVATPLNDSLPPIDARGELERPAKAASAAGEKAGGGGAGLAVPGVGPGLVAAGVVEAPPVAAAWRPTASITDIRFTALVCSASFCAADA